MIRLAVVSLVVMSVAGPVLARTIEVSRSGAAGPKTLAEAVAQAGAGDVIRLRAGVYREQGINLPRSGTSEKPITIEAAEGEHVVVCGSIPVGEWADAGGGVWKRGGWKINSQQLFVDGKPLKQIGATSPFTTTDSGDGKVCLPPVGRSAADLVDDSFHYDHDSKTLFCKLANNARPADHVIEASAGPSLINGNGQSHIVIRGITFRHNNGTSAGQRFGLVNVTGRGWLIEGCTFEYGDFAGIKIAGEEHIVRDCVIRGSGCVGVDVNGSDAAHDYARYDDRPKQNLLLERLTVTGSNRRAFNEYWHSGGMKLIPGVRGVTVRDCTVTDNAGPGIWFDAALGDNVIEDNLVVRNTVGISIEISYPVAGDAYAAMVRNNRVALNRDQGIYISASRGVKVVRNTLYHNAWDIVVHGMPRAEGSLGDNVVRDNILQGRNADLILYTGPGAGSAVVDGNLYARESGEARIGVTTGTGYDAASVDLPSFSKKHPGIEPTGESRAIRFADTDALDFRTVSPVDKGWSPASK